MATARGGARLVRRTVAVSIVLSVVIGTVFALLLTAIRGLNGAADYARRSQQVLVAASNLQLSILDVEDGLRGYLVTGQRQFLQPLLEGRSAFPGQSSELERLAARSSAPQAARVLQINAAGSDYIFRYADPIVALAQRDPAAARKELQAAEGKQRVDSLRSQFAQLNATEEQLLTARQARASADASLAVLTAAVAIPVSIAVILLAGGYLAFRVVRPVRRAAVLAGQVAEGDLSVRMSEEAPGEVGALQRALNTMTVSLGTSRDELRRAAEEQAALRRVATLVASGVPQDEVFHAVAGEAGLMLRAKRAAVARYGPDRVATVVGTWGEPGSAGPALGSRWAVTNNSNLGMVLATRAPARVTSYRDVPGELSAWARKQGVRWSVGTPITMEGATWGLAIVFSDRGRPPPSAEERMLGFTELAAMAIANTESRAKLMASRARVVTAADDARRRIERDLHDGAQQRLITLALELRAATDRLPPEQDWINERWNHAIGELREVVDDLREIARGLHPITLEKGGLQPALRALGRRCPVPAEVTVNVRGRLPERFEVAGYYVVSEALTNVVKHAKASMVRIEADVVDGALRLAVTDDGVGGANPIRGSGLMGLGDRVEALGGRVEITSPPGGGTSLVVTIPLEG